MTTLLIATRNKNKLKELTVLLEESNVKVVSLNELQDDIPEVDEDGETFQQNAAKKALLTATAANLLTLADDSGLCVDALDGKPGIYSARFAGNSKNDKENCKKVLTLLEGVEQQHRTASFWCSIALAEPHKLIGVVDGICKGIIAKRASGSNGFGYDPIFFYPALDKTFAELSAAEKNEVSHRYQALHSAKALLIQYLTNKKDNHLSP